MSKEKTLTTGEIAKYCNVNGRTAIRWLDKGYMPSYKLPGRGDRRVKEADLIKFLQDNDMPIPQELTQKKKIKVMVVDDVQHMADTIARVLKLAGYQVATAYDGFAAGALLNEFKPDILTLDLKMPGMDGFSVIEHIRQKMNNQKMKILVVSADGENSFERALALGADDYMRKPFENQDLVQKVQSIAV